MGDVSQELTVVDKEAVDESLRWFFMTPSEQRGSVITFEDLARKVGVCVGTLNKHLQMRPEVAMDVLQWTAASAAVNIPKMMRLLLEAAEAGSIRAIEVYLDHVRKTITDDKLIRAGSRPIQVLTVNQFLNETESSAMRLLKTAQAMANGTSFGGERNGDGEGSVLGSGTSSSGGLLKQDDKEKAEVRAMVALQTSPDIPRSEGRGAPLLQDKEINDPPPKVMIPPKPFLGDTPGDTSDIEVGKPSRKGQTLVPLDLTGE